MNVVFDNRWIGSHGIGRFASAVHANLTLPIKDIRGSHPASIKGIIELSSKVARSRPPGQQWVFFSPGYCPPIPGVGESVITVHDLIHLEVGDESSRSRTLFFERVVRPAIRKARTTLTVSHFSKERLVEWSGVPDERVVVVGDGVDPSFSAEGFAYDPGFPYVLSVGNRKPHKNLDRLVRATSSVPGIHLILSGSESRELLSLAKQLKCEDRLHFAGYIPEADLPAYYRGAVVVAIPSLYEGFGLPALEGMACGIPVVAANTTSLPEVVGNVGVLVDPTDCDSISDGLTRAITDSAIRARAKVQGPMRASQFQWGTVAGRVESELIGTSR